MNGTGNLSPWNLPQLSETIRVRALKVSRAAVPLSPWQGRVLCRRTPRDGSLTYQTRALPCPRRNLRCRQGSQGEGKTHSTLLRSIPGFSVILYTVRKRHLVYAVEKEGNNFQRLSLTVCQSNLLCPNDKRTSTAGSKAHGMKRRS